ncbi:MAG TPA: glycosyltransferase [Pyrinomonadaceae bacterium]|nr:glycosyltransferase [Pyrinomonadaceae bacterium]
MRILWLKTELLHPIDKGGRIRTYHMLRELRRDHEITYLTLDDGNAAADARERATEYCDHLITIPHHTRPKFSPGFYLDLTRNLATRLPYFIMKYESAEMRREIERVVAGGEIDVVVCDFLMPAINLPEHIDCATVLFQHNVEAMIWKRHYEVHKNPVKKGFLYGQWRKAFAFERDMCRRFDKVVAVSAEDREIMRADYAIDNLDEVPTGVDTEFFRPNPAVVREPRHLVFTGSLDWLPNDDAMRYFVNEILPLVRRTIPDVKLTVVGRNPYAGLIELSKTDPNIEVTGRVEDVRPYMDRASAYIVPIRVGSGTRLKIYEAMAMELPMVSTTVGAEGLNLIDGRDLLIADTPGDFAAGVVKLLTDDEFAHELGQRAAGEVRAKFGWHNAAQKFAEICESVATLQAVS